MNIEEILIRLGDKPLAKSPYSRVALAMINAKLEGRDQITLDMEGHEILSMIYHQEDNALVDDLLARRVGRVRNADTYRLLILFFSGLLGLVTVVMAFLEISTQRSVSTAGGGFFTQVVALLAELIQFIGDKL